MSENSKLSDLTPGRVPVLCSDFILKDKKLHVNISVKSPWKWEHTVHCLLILWFSKKVKAVKQGGECWPWISIQSGFTDPIWPYFFHPSSTFLSRKLRIHPNGCLFTFKHQQILLLPAALSILSYYSAAGQRLNLAQVWSGTQDDSISHLAEAAVSPARNPALLYF